MPEALLGFDARVVGPGADGVWSAERRREYLLRDVARPFSADLLVWPTAFRQSDPSRKPSPWDIGWVDRPEWIGPNDVWDSLSSMEKALAAAPPAPPGNELWKVAITWHARDELRAGPYGPYAEPTQPAVRLDSWEFLGFDVADPGISGLSNCGFEASERESLAPQWSERLNEHHLLIHPGEAYTFLQLANQRVPEHAPFFVLGLWRIP